MYIQTLHSPNNMPQYSRIQTKPVVSMSVDNQVDNLPGIKGNNETVTSVKFGSNYLSRIAKHPISSLLAIFLTGSGAFATSACTSQSGSSNGGAQCVHSIGSNFYENNDGGLVAAKGNPVSQPVACDVTPTPASAAPVATPVPPSGGSLNGCHNSYYDAVKGIEVCGEIA